MSAILTPFEVYKVKQEHSISLILVFLPLEWRYYHRRPQWLAIGEIAQVLAVEPPVGILSFWLHPERLLAFIRNRLKIRKGERGIFFFRPLTLVTVGIGYRIQWLAKLDRLLLKVQLRYVLRVLDVPFEKLATFIVTVQQHYMSNIIPAGLKCHEVTDEYFVIPGQEKIDVSCKRTKKAIRTERWILSHIDILFASSRALYESRSKVFLKTFYVPNSADYDHFSRALSADQEIPADVNDIPGPRIGYVGNINEVVDVDLINSIAESRREWSIILIGNENGSKNFKDSQTYRKCKSLPNIHFLGFRDYDLLPAYMKGFDVCLSPFSSSEWMRNSFPNKIFQYLATGTPVVSTDFPSIWELKDVVYIADNEKKYIELVDRALAEDNRELIEKRLRVARLNSTRVRAKQTLDILTESLSEKTLA